MENHVDLSILIVNYNTVNYVLDCVHSVFEKTQNLKFEIIIADNGSTDGSIDKIKQTFPTICLIENGRNIGFAAANNKMLRHTKGRHVILLNPDTRLRNNALTQFVQFLDNQPDAGICGGRLLNPDNTPGISYGNFPTYWHIFYRILGANTFIPRKWKPLYGMPFRENVSLPLKVDWISGANLCIRRELLARCGGLDASFFLFFEEVDLCYRVHKLGYNAYFLPWAEIYHIKSQRFKNSDAQFRINFYTSEFIFFKKHSRFSFVVYILNLLQWGIKYLKYSVRKKYKREMYQQLIRNIYAINNSRL